MLCPFFISYNSNLVWFSLNSKLYQNLSLSEKLARQMKQIQNSYVYSNNQTNRIVASEVLTKMYDHLEKQGIYFPQ